MSLESIARRAGEILLRYRGKLRKIEYKSSLADVVSEADYESQRLVFELASSEYPDHEMVGEENFDPSGMKKKKIILVDPLDGSLNYVHGLPYYSISIARLEEGKVVEGVVYLPETDEMFYALLDEGSYLNGVELKLDDGKPEEALVVTGWPYDHDGTLWTYDAIEVVNEGVQEIRILGSCASELAYLAAGRIDGYFEIGLGPWDLAAGYLIATQAGAIVTDLGGESFDLLKGEVVAGKPSVHRALLELLKKVRG